MEAYPERHHGRYCLVPEVLDGVFIHKSQYMALPPNEKEQLPWLLIIHKATKCLTAIMCHYSHALMLLYYVAIWVELIILITGDMDTH